MKYSVTKWEITVRWNRGHVDALRIHQKEGGRHTVHTPQPIKYRFRGELAHRLTVRGVRVGDVLGRTD